MTTNRAGRAVFFLLALVVSTSLCVAQSYKYIRIGEKADIPAAPRPGFALMGGGSDLDEAFRWLCERANGGDFLVLRAHGDDDYNAYIQPLCKLNSVATLIIPSKEAAQDPAVAEIISRAAALFIAGGDQANYLNFWTGTPVQTALNLAITHRGVPIGGTSAGLAVLGEFVYSAQNDKPDDENLSSRQTLNNPFDRRVTLRRDFIQVPLLRNIITDTHFKARDRMGRTLGFLSRIVQDGWSKNPRAIAVDEKTAVLLEPGGAATVVGLGSAYFLTVTKAPAVCRRDTPLTIRDLSVYRIAKGGHFDVSRCSGTGGTAYSLSVENGVIKSTQDNGAVY